MSNAIRICWASDIHLDSLPALVIDQTAERWSKSCDFLIITGDICTQRTFHLLERFLAPFHGKAAFTLGNHDYWHGSIVEAETKAKLIEENGLATYLDQHDFLRFGKTAIVGQYVWYDLASGSIRWMPPEFESVTDFSDFSGSHSKNGTWRPTKTSLSVMRHAAMIGTEKLFQKASKAIAAGCKKIVVATHVPPFSQACMHKNKPAEPDWLPVMTNENTLGESIRELAGEHPDVLFEIISGHTHNKFELEIYPNLRIKVASADYGDAMLQKELTLI